MQFRFFRLLSLISIFLILACHNNKTQVVDDNPVFTAPELSPITEKIHKDPDNARLYFERGRILNKMQLDTLALADFKKAAKLDSTKAEYFSAVGNLLFDHKDITGSIQWIKKAIELDPKDPVAHLKMAKLFVYIQDYPKAFNEINLVLRENNVYNPEAYFLKALIYRDLKDTSKSISEFQSAINADPNYKDAYVELGEMFSAKKNPIALKYFDDAFKLDTLDVFPLYAKGMYYQAQGKYEEAKLEYKNCILHNNQYANAYFNIGWILMQQDSLDKAWRHYDLVTKIDPANADAYYNRGLCSELMNKKQDAVSDYQQALIFDTAYSDAKNALKRLHAR
jgi:tetratricopeptide (TPR) repeat protein